MEEPGSNSVSAWGSATDRDPDGAAPSQAPIVAIARAGSPGSNGYWLAAADGEVFSFGDAPFYRSMGPSRSRHRSSTWRRRPTGWGTWLAGRNGQVYPLGVTDEGSPADDHAVEAPVVGVAAHSANGYWFALRERAVLEADDAGPDVRRLR